MPPKQQAKQKGKLTTATPKTKKVSIKRLRQKLEKQQEKVARAGGDRADELLATIDYRLRDSIADEDDRSQKIIDAFTRYQAKHPDWESKDVSRLSGYLTGLIKREVGIIEGASLGSSSSSSSSSRTEPIPAQPIFDSLVPAGLHGPASGDVSGMFFQPETFASQYDQPMDALAMMITSPIHQMIPPPTIGDDYVSAPPALFRSPPSVVSGSESGWEIDSSVSGLPSLAPVPDMPIPDVRETVGRNIQTSSGGGGEHAIMPHGESGLDIQYPTYNMVGGALDKHLKASLHGMLVAQTPNVYQSETLKDGNVLRDTWNPPKRSEILDDAMFKQPKIPEFTPYTFFNIGESYCNPAKIGTKSCFDKYTAKDPNVNLTGIFGDPFGVNFDDRWTRGTNPFMHTDRQANLPGSYVDYAKNFLTGYSRGT